MLRAVAMEGFWPQCLQENNHMWNWSFNKMDLAPLWGDSLADKYVCMWQYITGFNLVERFSCCAAFFLHKHMKLFVISDSAQSILGKISSSILKTVAFRNIILLLYIQEFYLLMKAIDYKRRMLQKMYFFSYQDPKNYF